MKIGVPKEIKKNENRVGLTPSSVKEFVGRGHEVFIHDSAGEGSFFENEEFEEAGARLLPDIESVYNNAEMIIKVKEPIEKEYDLIKKDQLIFTYFHFASSKKLTEAMIKTGSVCLAYETVEDTGHSLPLLIPMSEVAGRMAVQEGAKYLEKPMGGRGILLGGVPGVKPAKVVILGGGVVGTQAAKMASGMGAETVILDIDLQRLRYLEDVMADNVTTMMSNRYNIEKEVKEADLIVGAVLIHGSKAPKLVTRDMLKIMQKGTVMVDVAVDQGGCIETCKPTTHENPVYEIDGVVHYCVANMPGAVPCTSTIALNNATLPYGLELADKSWRQACRDNPELKKGLNVIHGKICYKGVSEAFNKDFAEVNEILALNE